ncbi:la-related protein 7 [Planococcus citri]|uniref:la-related protein 7 n=1 Tax=Planococcus citri TaxID=170843 RepID=UPI0031F7D946
MDETSNCHKKGDRQRKKRYYNDIRQQIEFYLGDVNLSKDRFFNGLLQESPYIDIDIILNCNKIKKLTCNPKDIVKALKTSEILSVTDDGTKIYRTVPVQPITNADECTIYVEDLPPETDHDWLKSVFKTYGNIVYVSVPRYKQSNKIKGFAFVQFVSSECANNALKAFQSANSCLSCNITPSDLCSVKTFEGEKEIVVVDNSKTSIDDIKVIPVKHEHEAKADHEVESPEEPQKKRRKKDKKDEHEEELKPESLEDIQKEDSAKENENRTKRKTDEKEVSEAEQKPKSEEIGTQKDESGKENENKTDDSDASQNEGADAENSFSEEKHSRKRKRKKNKKSEHVQTYGMQILSKQDWKKLRNRYLEEQRKKMHELKQQLRKARLNREQQEENEAKMKAEENEDKTKGEETPMEDARVKFTPGVIIKLRLDQPVTHVKNFKTEVKRYATVEYIDVNEENLEAYFRCSSNEAANQVIALNKWPNMEILKGDEEQQYWEKIKLDRKKKIDEKIRCKTRGKTKLIKKVEAVMVKQHIKFSD